MLTKRNVPVFYLMVSPQPLISGHLFVHLLLQMLLLLPLHDGGRPKVMGCHN
jgi:hypothetical protein